MPCPICSWSTEDRDYAFIHESKYWRAVLAPNQILLGRCAVHLKRHCGDVAEIHPEEALDWLRMAAVLETALRKAFDATMFNWSCLMNLAYREKPPDPHIHWWLVPRYNHSVMVGGLPFEDPQFGGPYDHAARREIPEDVRRLIAERIRRFIGQGNGSTGNGGGICSTR